MATRPAPLLPGIYHRAAIPPTTFTPFDASLDTPEIPVESTPASSSPTYPTIPETGQSSFRHSGWKRRRSMVTLALETALVPINRYLAFTTCSCHAWVLRSKTDPRLVKFAIDACHDRFCIPCANARATTIRLNLAQCLPDTPARMVTLTLRSTLESLRSCLTRLKKAFRRLRSRAFWKERVQGGVAFIELTRGADSSHWHVHFHVLAWGKYIPQPLLSRAWRDCTGDSPIVDIRLVRDQQQVTRYVTKYVTKPAPSVVYNDLSLLTEAIQALRNTKLLYTFGICRTWKLLETPSDDAWESLGHINEISASEALSESEKLAIFAAYRDFADHSVANVFLLPLSTQESGP